MEHLYESLKRAGQAPFKLGDCIIALPFSGRILGLYPDRKTNLFWVNEALSSWETARSFLGGSGWLNIGGDRTWISPEIETHIADRTLYPKGIEVPSSVDPGSYIVENADVTSIIISSYMHVRFHQSGVTLPMNLTKRAVVMTRPPFELSDSVSFAGYTMKYTLEVTEQVRTAARPGLWNLIQVPCGGDITVPVREGAKLCPFIGKPVYSLEGNLVKCRVETDSSFKFSLKAHSSKGVMAYRKTLGDNAMLVVRTFTVADPSRYADYPSFDPSDDGYMTEVYIDDGQYGGFGELEYHSTAIDIAKGEHDLADTNETWGCVGPREAVEEVYTAVVNRS